MKTDSSEGSVKSRHITGAHFLRNMSVGEQHICISGGPVATTTTYSAKTRRDGRTPRPWRVAQTQWVNCLQTRPDAQISRQTSSKFKAKEEVEQYTWYFFDILHSLYFRQSFDGFWFCPAEMATVWFYHTANERKRVHPPDASLRSKSFHAAFGIALSSVSDPEASSRSKLSLFAVGFQG